MRPPLARLKNVLTKEAAMAREKLAADVLAPEKIREMLHKAASQGHGGWRVVIPCPVNIHSTKAARTLEAWLAEQGLRCSWEKRGTDTPDGRRLDVSELLVMWE